MIKRTLSDLFLNQVEKSGSDMAIGWIENERVLSTDFLGYKKIVETLSLALVNLGVEKQDKVCILSNTRKEWHYTDLAIICTGAISVPIYPNYTEEEILFIINHSDAEFIVIENEIQFQKILNIASKLERVKKIISFENISNEKKILLDKKIDLISFDEAISLGALDITANPDKFDYLTRAIHEEDIATIVYTSGTTGRPKGAVITQRAFCQVLLNIKKFSKNAFNKNDSVLTFLPLAHVLGRCESFFPIIFGCQNVYARSLDLILEDIDVVKPTLMVGVPRFFEKIYEGTIQLIEDNPVKMNVFKWASSIANEYYQAIEQDRTPPIKVILEYQLAKKLVFNKIHAAFGGKIRFFISGGAPLQIEIIKFLRNSNLTVLEGYGLTETVAPCFVNPMNKQIAGTVGQPIGDVEVKIADDGEILLKTQAMFTEYFKDEEATKEVFNNEGWFLTGDIGEINAQGFLQITDRKKDIIITSGGKNIAPGKIENLLKSSPYISTPIVVGEKRKHLNALIGINLEALRGHFEDFGINDGAQVEELSTNPKIIALIKREIDVLNEQLATFETIKNFKILPISIGEHNYLTPSLKVKRKLIEKDFKSLIDAMYK